jgi:SAM-dependent methyltransferase
MTEVSPPNQGFFRKLLERITDESIDPFDTSHVQFFERLIPGMRPEHALRYSFAAHLLKGRQRLNPEVIDAATGQGYGAKILRELIPEARITGIDINLDTIKTATQKYGKYGRYLQGDVRHIPIGNTTADMITAFETLEHLAREDQPVFLRELHRVVKPDGLVVISVPFPSSTYLGKDKTVHYGWGSGSHLYEPTREEIKIMIHDAGLEVVGEYGQVLTDSRITKAVSIVNRVIPIWLMYAWLGRKDHGVHPVTDTKHKTSLIHIFVTQPNQGIQ